MFILIGNQVSRNDPFSILTSVNPAWRRSALHIMVTSSPTWNDSASTAETQRQMETVHSYTEQLNAMWPDSGAYMNEGLFTVLFMTHSNQWVYQRMSVNLTGKPHSGAAIIMNASS